MFPGNVLNLRDSCSLWLIPVLETFDLCMWCICDGCVSRHMHATVPVWRSEDNTGVWVFSFHLAWDIVSLVCCCEHQISCPTSFGIFLIQPPIELGLQTYAPLCIWLYVTSGDLNSSHWAYSASTFNHWDIFPDWKIIMLTFLQMMLLMSL